MWLVVESGSTKTDWIFFDQENIMETIATIGLNPLFVSEAEITNLLNLNLPQKYAGITSKIWFYGAGCGTKKEDEKILKVLQLYFKNASIKVFSDIMASARACCGHKPGLVGILGTGSNTAVYNGTSISKQIAPLGYVLGDEGGGVALGKSLLNRLLRNNLEPKLTKELYQNIGLNYNQILQKVYNEPRANKFIASLAKWVYTFKNHHQIEALISREFSKFLELLKNYNTTYNVCLTGSVAHAFEPELKLILKEGGFGLEKVIKSPVYELVAFHRSGGG